MYKVFVYGTLLRGCSNSHVMKEAGGKCIGKAVLKGYEMYSNGYYPMIIKGTGRVIGELYEVDNAGLERIDRLEGYPHLYIREAVTVQLESGELVKALVYTQTHNSELVRKTKEKVPEGDWIRWLVRKECEANAGV